METEQISCVEKLPSLSTRHQWFIAQNLESNNQIFYTLDNPQNYFQCQINELQGRRIRACFHGWVILSDHPDNVLWSLWNPLTSNFISLPPLIHKETDPQEHCLSSHPDRPPPVFEKEIGSHECCLSSHPENQGSVFLLTTVKVPTIVFCLLDSKREGLKWMEMSYAKQLRSILGVDGCFLERPTCCNSKVYAITSGPYYDFVIEVDIVVKGEEVVISLLPFVETPSASYIRFPSYLFLKGSCLELFLVAVCFTNERRIGDVYLFKLDINSMTWDEMVDLKDAIFFLEFASDYPTCYYYSFAADPKLEGYVHILGESGKTIYSFHAKDRTMSISSMPCLVRESQAKTWAMLEWRFEVDHAISKQDEEDNDTEIVIRPVKGDNIEFGITTGESHLLDIPIHILELIMELCIGIEYIRFRATCKHFYLAIPMIQWSNKTTLKRLQTYSLDSPFFMVLDNYQGIFTFIDPIRSDRYFIKVPQELKGDYQICCSKYGWLLLHELGGPMVFFNPLTSNIIKLPPPPCVESLCFSAPPTSPDCMVVGFIKYGRENVYYHFVSRESLWHESSLDFGDDDPYSFHFPTFNGRNVYALCNNKGLDAFRDMNGVDYSWETVVDKAPISGYRSPTWYFLSNCDKHLLLVVMSEFGESVELFKLNESTGEWEKTDGLGKHMIYISDTSCICREASLPEMENKIYFPRLLHMGGTKIVFYSLETCKYHTFDGQNIQESFGTDLFGTKNHCFPHTWIEPSWS